MMTLWSRCSSAFWKAITIRLQNFDLTPSDYNLFLHLMKFLFSQHLPGDEDVETAVIHYLQSLAAAYFYDTGLEKLILQYDKCSYVEKYLKGCYIRFNKCFQVTMFCFCFQLVQNLLSGCSLYTNSLKWLFWPYTEC